MRHYLLVSVSHQEIHRWVQEAGKAREEEQKEKEEGVYQRGEKVEGEGSAEVVVIEADELYNGPRNLDTKNGGPKRQN
ncbi:MAG: hypothetical protein L5656_10305, partial [Thermanaeromonas sp.]|uniref:hypothetical protein n=1 Tax=Thermanaeromonas sp. TaxID=2003697 RepID=UPI00243E2FE1